VNDDEDAALTDHETRTFDDIVRQEWPEEEGRVGESGCPESEQAEPTARVPVVITVYRPRRPTPWPLLLGLSVLAAIAAFTGTTVVTAVGATSAVTLTALERSDAARQVAAMTVVAGAGIVLALAMLGAWVVLLGRFRLRRSAWRIAVAEAHHAVERRVRPPNPATALAWAAALILATIAAGWWLPIQLEELAVAPALSAARDLTTQFTLAATAWCGIALSSAIGLTAWTCREARHQIRRAANRPSVDP
jgi:hypothetical protein